MSNANNGLLTKIWGPPLWEALHSITFGYPIEPTEEKKNQYKQWLLGLGHVLPCRYCRDSYNKFILEGDSELRDEDLESRDTLCRWGYRMHNRVNNKLGVDYGTKYEDLVERYESYRAKCVKKDQGCTMPIDLKADSYRKSAIKQAPVVPYEFSKLFVDYAKYRGLTKYEEELDETYTKMQSGDRRDRDETCVRLIRFMRKNSKDCTENEGEFKGLPTIYELALLSKCCSNINSHTFDSVKDKLNKWIKGDPDV